MTEIEQATADTDAKLGMRAAEWADRDAVAGLIYAVCEADGDATVATTPEELGNQWCKDGFDLSTDTLVVESADKEIVGYEEFVNEQEHYSLRIDGYVHPKFRGRGIGTQLVRAIETRALQEVSLAEADLRIFLRGTIDNRDQPSHDLFITEGYSRTRYFWRMEITLEDAPPAPLWPQGVELRPFLREQHERLVWEAQNESFRDHWGHHDTPFEEFSRWRFDLPGYDPTLWVIAWDGDEIAGISINRHRNGIGWIGTLGVRRPWRKHGLGLALLQHSFGEFHRRGTRVIGLGVDASNPTGATRLYERAGMHTASEFLMFEKELRPGRDLGD